MTNLILLALTLYLEAGNQPLAVKFAVAQVIMERVADKRWPDSIRDVVLQTNQFSCWNDRTPDSVVIPMNRSLRECQDIAIACINGRVKGAGYNHYHDTSVHPYWADGKEGVQIGGLVFYKL